MWTAEDIAEANSRQPGQSRSKLEYILCLGGANLELIADIASEMQSRKTNFVAAFVQLPYAVAAGADWYRVPGLTETLHCELRFEVCRLKLDASGKFSLTRNPDNSSDQEPLVTQVVALFPVWGIRARFHDKYLQHVDDRQNKSVEIVPQRLSWIDTRPITLQGYQNNFAVRLIREVQAALRNFLPAYSIVSFHEARIHQNLFSYFAMLAPGYLAFGGQFVPMPAALLSNASNTHSPVLVNRAAMQAALRIRHREISRFEAQILALERLRIQGESALALIGTLSLLEWLLDTFIQKRGEVSKNLSLHRVMRHPLITFLDSTEFELLDKARDTRNRAVHEAPPVRHSLKYPDNRSGQQADGLDSSMTSDEVKDVIRLVFELYKRINQIEASILRKKMNK